MRHGTEVDRQPPARKRAERQRAPEAPLARYNAKRDFEVTSEPAGRIGRRSYEQALSFVIQKHWASHLHYDFRLELDGVMVSWAVPKGPSCDPAIKQMAIHVEDHPISYNTFEGTIPKGQYGAGTVIVWDRGTWQPVGDAHDGLRSGKLIFRLHGEKLAGLWELVRISKPGEVKQEQWLLLKKRGDAWARSSAEYDVISALPDSVVAKPLGLVEEREPRGLVDAPRKGVTIDLSAAVEGVLPAKLQPQLATLATTVPPGDWIVENKFDGYRMLARITDGRVRLLTRNGLDWTAKLKALAEAVAKVGIEQAWLDGEIVVLNGRGVPEFNRLQNAIDNSRSVDIVYFVFDVPFLGSQDLRQVPLASRRMILENLFAAAPPSDRVRFSQAFDARPQDLLRAACEMGLEGVMLKRRDASYASRRTDTWLKLKCQLRQEFVVIGFTGRSGASSEVGGLLLGYHEDGRLRYAGSVGTGWDAPTGRDLMTRLMKLKIERPPVDASTVKPGRWSKSRKSWSRLPSRNGRPMATYATRPTVACGRTRHRVRSFAKRPLRRRGRPPCLRPQETDASRA
jgi:bifunctional non-homologous end joining protein LigD